MNAEVECLSCGPEWPQWRVDYVVAEEVSEEQLELANKLASKTTSEELRSRFRAVAGGGGAAGAATEGNGTTTTTTAAAATEVSFYIFFRADRVLCCRQVQSAILTSLYNIVDRCESSSLSSSLSTSSSSLKSSSFFSMKLFGAEVYTRISRVWGFKESCELFKPVAGEKVFIAMLTNSRRSPSAELFAELDEDFRNIKIEKKNLGSSCSQTRRPDIAWIAKHYSVAAHHQELPNYLELGVLTSIATKGI